jgi:hypothetical protein
MYRWACRRSTCSSSANPTPTPNPNPNPNQVGLPPKHVLVERVPLSPEEADFYEAVRSRSKVLP